MIQTTTIRWGLIKEDGALLSNRNSEPRTLSTRHDARFEKTWYAMAWEPQSLRVVKLRVQTTYEVIE